MRRLIHHLLVYPALAVPCALLLWGFAEVAVGSISKGIVLGFIALGVVQILKPGKGQ